MSCLLILASPPDHPSSTSFWKELQDHRGDQPALLVYCLHEGATALNDLRAATPNVRFFACPRAVEKFAPSVRDLVTLGGPGLLAELIERVDHIKAFSPT